jgi:chemotaxis-related protein WspD
MTVSARAAVTMDAGDLDAATAHYALPREGERRVTASVLVFRLGAEWLALSTVLFDRIADVLPVHSLPHRRGALNAGLVTVGGDLVVHLSLATLLGVEAASAVPATDAAGRQVVPRLVVLSDEHGRLAFTADEVWGVYDHAADELRPAPSTLARSLVSYATAMLVVQGRQVGCLDGARVMSALSLALA